MATRRFTLKLQSAVEMSRRCDRCNMHVSRHSMYGLQDVREFVPGCRRVCRACYEDVFPMMSVAAKTGISGERLMRSVNTALAYRKHRKGPDGWHLEAEARRWLEISRSAPPFPLP